MKIKLTKTLIFLFSFSLLQSCSKGTDDLQAFIQNTKKNSVGRVKKLPEYIPYKQFVYTSDGLRDPFIPENEILSEKVENTGNKLTPDASRKKEPLENFPLDTLKMVGTLEREHTWALIRTPEGSIFRVREGNYMGQNNGKIIALDQSKVIVQELIKNGMGEWVERTAQISMGE